MIAGRVSKLVLDIKPMNKGVKEVRKTVPEFIYSIFAIET